MNKQLKLLIFLISLSVGLLSLFNNTMDKKNLNKGERTVRIKEALEQDRFLTADKNTGKKEVSRLLPILRNIESQPANRSTSSTLNWESRGPLQVAGRARALMFDPNDATHKKIWSGGVNGGIWYNNDYTDESVIWQQVASTMDNYAVTCLTFDPNNTHIFYAGTGEAYGNSDAALGGGIWKSIDSGATWTRLASTGNGYITDMIVVNVGGASELYYTSRYTPGGLYKSTNGGTTFNQVVSYDVANIEVDANNNIWISTFNGKIFRSTDNGATFTQKYSDTSTQRTEIACAPSNSDYIYAIQVKNGGLDKIILSTNAGNSWTEINKPQDLDTSVPNDDFTNGQGWYDLVLKVNPADEEMIYLGGLNSFVSPNAGTDYFQLSDWRGDNGLEYMHADQHNFMFCPNNTNDGIASNDGGVFYIHNLVQSFTNQREIFERNLNFNITQFYSCAISPNETNLFLAGAQDNGTQKFDDVGIDDTEEMPSGGDGGFCFIDKTNGDYKIYSVYYNNYDIKGSFGTHTLLNDSSTGFFINRADYDDNKNILYTTKNSNKLYRVTLPNDNSSTFSSTVDEITINGLANKATHIRVSPYTVTASKLFVGDSSGNIVRVDDASTDTNPTTTTISGGISATGSVSCIDFGGSEDTIIATFSNYGEISVWYTENGGATWENKEGNLPDMPVRWAQFNHLNTNEVLLATELGIWKTSNITANLPVWEFDSGNIGACRVDMFQYRASDNTLIAATHGRGLFSTQSLSNLGVHDIQLTNENITLFPNPATELFYIHSDTYLEGANIQIMNETGKTVLRSKQNIEENRITTIDISSLFTGIYIIKITNSKYSFHSKLIIQ